MRPGWTIFALGLAACGGGVDEGSSATDAGVAPPDPCCATSVVSFTPGEAAGFGQDRMPDVVLGPPEGRGSNAGSLDVVSLGRGGSIVLAFERDLVDGPGPDLIVFENPFIASDGSVFAEPGIVAASEDGVTFVSWPCAKDDAEGHFPGCAGATPVAAGVGPSDLAQVGGDGFDLADIGLSRARYVRITDAGTGRYGAPSGGFDLDAVAIVNGADRP